LPKKITKTTAVDSKWKYYYLFKKKKKSKTKQRKAKQSKAKQSTREGRKPLPDTSGFHLGKHTRA